MAHPGFGEIGNLRLGKPGEPQTFVKLQQEITQNPERRIAMNEALYLIGHKDVRFLLSHLERIDNPDYNQIARSIVDVGRTYLLCDHLSVMHGLDNVVLRAILEIYDRAQHVWNNRSVFTEKDLSSFARILIEYDRASVVARGLGALNARERSQLAVLLLDNDGGYALSTVIDAFTDLDSSVVQACLRHNAAFLILEHPQSFSELNAQDVAMRMVVDAKNARLLAQHWSNLTGLDSAAIRDVVLAAGDSEIILTLLPRLSDVPVSTLITILTHLPHETERVLPYLDHFETVPASQQSEVIIALLDAKQGYALSHSLGTVPAYLHKQIVIEIARRREYAGMIGMCLEAAQGLDQEVASVLVENGHITIVVKYIKQFTVDRAWVIAEAMKQKEGIRALMKYCEYFPSVSLETLAIALVEKGGASELLSVQAPQNFSATVAQAILSTDKKYVVPMHIEKFDARDHKAIALQAIQHGMGRDVLRCAQNFSGLDKEVLAELYLHHVGVDRPKLHLFGEGSTPVTKSVLAFFEDVQIPAAYKQDQMPTIGDLKGMDERTVHIVLRSRFTHGLSPALLSALVARFPEIITSERCSPQQVADALLTYWDEMGGSDTENPLGNETLAIADSFRWFVSTFGAEVTLAFGNRPGLDPHTAYLSKPHLQNFLSINPDCRPQLFGSVLWQVADDSVNYAGIGASQLLFNKVMAEVGSTCIQDFIARITTSDVDWLSARGGALSHSRFHPYVSWRGLKDVANLIRVIGQEDFLRQLNDSKDLPQATRTFARQLLEHPSVPVDVIVQFIQYPAEFLRRDGQYVAAKLQRDVSPVNMLMVEGLALTPENVRDALADGTLDRLQIFPPATMELALDNDGADTSSQGWLQARALQAIGRKIEPVVVGQARDQKKLFAEVKAIFQRYNIDAQKLAPWIRGEIEITNWSDDVRKELDAAIFGNTIGIDRPTVHKVRIRIGKKSDPSMVVAGNDTASCMPFGDGKTNAYLWNPACAFLIVERQTDDGCWRTAAQSVVMPTLPIDTLAPERFRALSIGNQTHKLMSASDFIATPVVICDNIEPNPNEVLKGRMPIIEAAYRNFFTAYLAQHSQRIGVDPSQVMIGKETYLTGDRLTCEQVDNRYIPVAPISYTDNGSSKSYRMTTGLEGVPQVKTGVATVTAADILAMSYLEGQSFRDNENMIFGLYNQQHRIIGSQISAEQHGDPYLNLISRNDHGEPVGYIIAYLDHRYDVPEVYIDDFAVDRSRRLAASRHAIRLIDTLLERYADHYVRTGQPLPPIFAEMREDTSYKLVTRQAKRFAQDKGLAIELCEDGVSELAGEPMHHVRIFVGRDNAELAANKSRFEQRKQIAP